MCYSRLKETETLNELIAYLGCKTQTMKQNYENNW